ncbi:DNA-packaging protein [bacterium]|nr:MAG: DNA-packaging protein [bacterium]
MAFQKGNQLYKLRSKDGKDKVFEKPEDLFNACNEYFEWCEENPLQEEVVFHSQGNITKTTVAKRRPFTLNGLCIFIDISLDGFYLYEKRDDYVGVTKKVREIIYNQKFEGAASGFFNANIIARDLGLADKSDITSQGEKVQIYLPDNGRK